MKREAGLVVCVVVGWVLVTYAVASFFGVPEVYALSGGLFLLSLAGWGYLWDLVRDGFYVLSLPTGKAGDE